MAKVMTGSRGKLFIDGTLCGVFESISYSSNLEVEPVYVLGSAIPKEFTPLAFSPVQINCSGFRLIDQGPHVSAKFPKLQDFLTISGVTIEVIDRQTGKLVLKAKDCVPTSNSGGYNNRATSRIQVSYVGVAAIDESGDQAEIDGTELP